MKSTLLASLPRRSFLRGALGGASVSIALPIMDAMLNDRGDAFAAGTALPRRFGVFHWGCGIVHGAWVPKTTGTDYALSESLAGFAAVKPYLTVITGTNHKGTSPGHIPARGVALSSSHDLTICQGNCVGTYRGQNHPEPSIDNLVAEAWKGQAPFDLLAVSVCTGGPYLGNSSWKRGGTAYNRPEGSPTKLFDRLFSGALPQTPAPGVTAVSTALDKSVLDAVTADAKAIQLRVGSTDRRRLEQHLDGLRALERRLQDRQKIVSAAAACAKPLRPASEGGSKEAKNRLMADLIATALACDLTRVVSYEWSANQSGASYDEIGAGGDHHEISHGDFGKLQKITGFIMKNLAYLAEALKGKAEGAGNVLDNSLILATSEHANPAAHNWRDHPLLFVGKAGGAIRSGIHWRHPSPGDNSDAPRVLLTAVRAVGVNAARLGQDTGEGRSVTTGIPDLLA